ncbi:MAG: RHS repeat-associated core domain-containing protein [Gammaproteobacteria bacterium]|nr:RHS repeat-associated core domain-containing protein [Gammaproteobacteria bacterium]
MAYTAFGQRRQGDWRAADPLLPIIPKLTNRGFTGHEHIDEMGFIHMNGRVYNPSIGRFLSADPYIQDPYNTQSYNRYSYVLNNPLKYTDPSGYWGWNPFKVITKAWKTVKKYAKEIVTIAAVIYTGGATLAAGWSAWASGAAAGFVGGAIGTGSLKGAVQGAILGGVTAGIANHVGHGNSTFANRAQDNVYNKAIAHGLSQGTISQISGGTFKEGFLSGAFSSYTGDAWLDTSSNNVFTDTMISSMSGGIVAELGGGKFANGARSAAFVHLFNHGFGEGHTHNNKDPNSRFKYIDPESRTRVTIKGVCNNMYSSNCTSMDLVDWDASKEYGQYLNTKTAESLSVGLDIINPIKKVRWLDEGLGFIQQQIDNYILLNGKK